MRPRKDILDDTKPWGSFALLMMEVLLDIRDGLARLGRKFDGE